jgi:hypothetical protein
MTMNFALTGGLTGLSLLSGNGGPDGDGLILTGTLLADANPLTVIGQATDVPPFTDGTARSGYGSVQLFGTISTLTITLAPNANAFTGDGGSFTISQAEIPEPASVALWGLGAAGLALVAWRRRRKSTS